MPLQHPSYPHEPTLVTALHHTQILAALSKITSHISSAKKFKKAAPLLAQLMAK